MVTCNEKREFPIHFKDSECARYFAEWFKGECTLDPDLNDRVMTKPMYAYEALAMEQWAASRNLI